MVVVVDDLSGWVHGLHVVVHSKESVPEVPRWNQDQLRMTLDQSVIYNHELLHQFLSSDLFSYSSQLQNTPILPKTRC